MIVAMEIDEALHQSLRAALVLTGSVEGAECAVTNAIAALGSDCSAEALLLETARSAVEHNTFSAQVSPMLPAELQALFLLSPTRRYCFVLRVLVRFDLETCSRILKLSQKEVGEALCHTILELPRAVDKVASLTSRIQ
jgi:hypothetical protein